METEKIELLLNYMGSDYHVIVDMDTANILLNDPDEADRFIRNMQCENEEVKSPAAESQVDSQELFESPEPCTSNAGESPILGLPRIWINKHPTERDHEATLKFLELRVKYTEKFNDKKTVKNQIWNEIAEEMSNYGFFIAASKRDATERLRQKFANLQKQYLNYIKHVNTTGEKKKDRPPYFDEMHSILGEKDKSNPRSLQDSLSDDVENATEQDAYKMNIKNRFSTVTTSCKPQGTKTHLVDLLKKQFEDDRQDRDRHFKALENLLKIQNEQRERLLKQMEHGFKLQKKRKRSSSSESE